MQPIRQIAILGGGSAGWLAAITLRRMLPAVKVTVVQSLDIPVIGVGESTTAFIPHYLHRLMGLDQKQFYDQVRPSWKLGIKFLWGDPAVPSFYYPFDGMFANDPPGLEKSPAFFCLDSVVDASHYQAIMEIDRSPCIQAPNGSVIVNEGFGYHIPNQEFLQYLQQKSIEFGAELIEGEVSSIARGDDGGIAALNLSDGRIVAADMFIDASGFKSLLLDQVLNEPYLSYSDALFCDTAVIGSWDREGAILPYTTAETMDHGWAWQIEFIDKVTRGYVFSSAFTDPDTAAAELKAKNPQLTGELRTLTFTSGRRQRYWVKNVAAIGNAAGFVEPLEATALHMILEQLWSMALLIRESNGRPAQISINKENMRFANLWDEVRDFLALHYKFNRWSNSEFWRHCREETPLGSIQELVDFYQEAGPGRMCDACMPVGSIFRYTGYIAMLIGMRVPTKCEVHHTEAQLAAWNRYQETIRRDISNTVPVREGLAAVMNPLWQWPRQGN